MSVADEIMKMVSERYGTDPVSPDTALAIPAKDHVALAHLLEDQFGVLVDHAELEAVRTVGGLIALVAGKRAV